MTGDLALQSFAAGSVIGMQYRKANYAADEWDIYWYEKNLQGDIVAVYNEVGVKLVVYGYNVYSSGYFDPAHKGGISCGYLNHYHMNSGYWNSENTKKFHRNHIWYYGE